MAFAVTAFAVTTPPAPVYAQSADVYVCSGLNGVPEYRNNNAGRDCKRLNLPDVVSVPGIRKSPSRGGTAGGAAVLPSPTPSSSFPRVDSATQRTRDDERRGVLEHELQAEQAKLGALRAESGGGPPERQGNERNYQKYLDRAAALRDDIVRTEANVSSLRWELNNLK